MHLISTFYGFYIIKFLDPKIILVFFELKIFDAGNLTENHREPNGHRLAAENWVKAIMVIVMLVTTRCW